MKRKKIRIIFAVIFGIALIGGLVVYFMDWGNETSAVKKTETGASRMIKSASGKDIKDITELDGTYISNPDPAKSEILFTVAGPKSATGKFRKFKATLQIDGEIEKAKITVSINVGSLSTKNDERDKHLMDADFFNEPEYPEIVFTSEKITVGDTGYIAQGHIEFLGMWHPFQFPFTYEGKGNYDDGKAFASFSGRFSFGHVSMGMPDNTSVGETADVTFYTEMVLGGVEPGTSENEETDTDEKTKTIEYKGDSLDAVFDKIEQEALEPSGK